jgi:hypothetical protein
MIGLDAMPETVSSQAAFGELVDRSREMINRWSWAGKIVYDEAGNIRVRESIDKLGADLHPGRGGDRVNGKLRIGAGDTDADARGDYTTEAAREKRASAQLKEIELAERAGEVVAASAVRDATMRRVQAAKSVLFALPRRIAPKLAAETEPLAVEKILSAELRAVFEELAKDGEQAPLPSKANAA